MNKTYEDFVLMGIAGLNIPQQLQFYGVDINTLNEWKRKAGRFGKFCTNKKTDVKRNCLTCNTTFIADTRFIRVCNKCKSSDEWKNY
tara:strand:- start:4635 stop:4895 length:261 start_codon:yes stop_codon:yes gene_type:complete